MMQKIDLWWSIPPESPNFSHDKMADVKMIRENSLIFCRFGGSWAVITLHNNTWKPYTQIYYNVLISGSFNVSIFFKKCPKLRSETLAQVCTRALDWHMNINMAVVNIFSAMQPAGLKQVIYIESMMGKRRRAPGPVGQKWSYTHKFKVEILSSHKCDSDCESNR